MPRIGSPGYDAAFMTTKPSPRPPSLREKSQLMSASEIERTLVRLVHEIVEKNNGAKDLGLVGIRRRGVPMAQRLGEMITRIEKTPVPVGTLDITLYRDDLSTLGPKPVVQKTEVGFPIPEKTSSWWTTCSIPGAPFVPPWTPCSARDGQNRCSYVC